MEINEIIATCGGVGGLLSVIWAAINLRARKKVETAKAAKEEAEADRAVADNWQNYATKMEEFNSRLNDKVDNLYRLINEEKSEKRDAQYHYCSNIACEKRTPPLGTYKGRKNDK